MISPAPAVGSLVTLHAAIRDGRRWGVYCVVLGSSPTRDSVYVLDTCDMYVWHLTVNMFNMMFSPVAVGEK